MAESKLKFGTSNNSPFYTELKKRVDHYFLSNGYSRHANGAMIFKIIFIILILTGSYAALLSNRLTEFQMLLCALLFGLGKGLIAFNIAHDASHGALFKNARLNHIFSYSFNLIGVSNYIWNIKHNLSHHTFTNIPGHDMDIEQTKIARFTVNTPPKWFHRYQHLYLPFFYPFLSIFIIFIKDFMMFGKQKYGNSEVSHPGKEYWILFISKLFYLTYALIIPLVVIDLPWYKILLGFLLVHMVVGLFLATILIPVHALDDSDFPEPDENGIIDNSWVVHQIESTSNYGANNWLLTWLAGGLNTHIIHHVFPNICHIHYYELTKIIRQTSHEYGIKFRDKTIGDAAISHLRFLKTMGRNSIKSSK